MVKMMEHDRQRVHNLEKVLEASEELGRARSCDEIAEILAARYVDIIKATYSSVALLTDYGKSLQLRAMSSIRPLKEKKRLGLELPLDDMPLLKSIINRRDDILVETGNPHSELNDKERELLLTSSTKSALFPPLLAGDKPIGIIAIGEERRQERESFNKNKIKVAHVLARQAGIAIENINAYMDLQDTMDKLQKAYLAMIQQDKMLAIGRLAAGMAHEINNPNAYVLSNLSTLQEYAADLFRAYDNARRLADKYASSEEIKCLEQIERELGIEEMRDDYTELMAEVSEGAKRIAQIINDLRYFSGEGEKQEQLLDVSEIVMNSVNVIRSHLKHKASIETDIPPLPPIKGNRALLGQVFFNILLNAGDFLDSEKFPHNKLNIKGLEEAEYVVVMIEDNGPGIDSDIIGRIFEPFFTTKDVGKGTGMGLAVAHDIVRKHDGMIKVKSKPNEGTQFILRFPKASEKKDNQA